MLDDFYTYVKHSRFEVKSWDNQCTSLMTSTNARICFKIPPCARRVLVINKIELIHATHAPEGVKSCVTVIRHKASWTAS